MDVLFHFISFMKSASGRRVFQSAVKEDPRGLLERLEVRMLAQVSFLGNVNQPRVSRA